MVALCRIYPQSMQVYKICWIVSTLALTSVRNALSPIICKLRTSRVTLVARGYLSRLKRMLCCRLRAFRHKSWKIARARPKSKSRTKAFSTVQMKCWAANPKRIPDTSPFSLWKENRNPNKKNNRSLTATFRARSPIIWTSLYSLEFYQTTRLLPNSSWKLTSPRQLGLISQVRCPAQLARTTPSRGYRFARWARLWWLEMPRRSSSRTVLIRGALPSKWQA